MQLRVLTFNTWGVPFFSRDRAARMRAIGSAIAQMDVDVVGLQEVFYDKDRRLLTRAAAQGGLTHSHYFLSGVVGSGLLTLSRYPIVETGFLRFRLNGRPQDIVRSDYYAGKGVGRVRIDTPGGLVDVYNAHFIAPYLEWGPDRFAAHRVTQALEAGRYIASMSDKIPAVLTCDLNCYPDDPTYRTLVAAGELVETYTEANADGSFPAAPARNGYATIHPPDRFDYVFARSGRSECLSATRAEFVLGGAPQPNLEGIRGYSDHYGVLTELKLQPAMQAAPVIPTAADLLKTLLEGALGHGILTNHKVQRRAGLVAAAASVSSAALAGRRRPAGTGWRVLAGGLLIGLILTGGVNLSTAARLDRETRTLAGLLGEEL